MQEYVRSYGVLSVVSHLWSLPLSASPAWELAGRSFVDSPPMSLICGLTVRASPIPKSVERPFVITHLLSPIGGLPVSASPTPKSVGRSGLPTVVSQTEVTHVQVVQGLDARVQSM